MMILSTVGSFEVWELRLSLCQYASCYKKSLVYLDLDPDPGLATQQGGARTLVNIRFKGKAKSRCQAVPCPGFQYTIIRSLLLVSRTAVVAPSFACVNNGLSDSLFWKSENVRPG